MESIGIRNMETYQRPTLELLTWSSPLALIVSFLALGIHDRPHSVTTIRVHNVPDVQITFVPISSDCQHPNVIIPKRSQRTHQGIIAIPLDRGCLSQVRRGSVVDVIMYVNLFLRSIMKIIQKRRQEQHTTKSRVNHRRLCVRPWTNTNSFVDDHDVEHSGVRGWKLTLAQPLAGPESWMGLKKGSGLTLMFV